MAISLINAIIKTSSSSKKKEEHEYITELKNLKDYSLLDDEDIYTKKVSFNEVVYIKVVDKLYNSEKTRRKSFYNDLDFMKFHMESKKKV